MQVLWERLDRYSASGDMSDISYISPPLYPLEASRYLQHLPAHVVRQRRGEEEDGASGLLRGAGPPQGNHKLGHLAHSVGNAEGDFMIAPHGCFALLFGLRQARLDHTEGYSVHLDVEPSPLFRESPRQPDDARLAGGVIGLPGVATRAGRRGDVDDLP